MNQFDTSMAAAQRQYDRQEPVFNDEEKTSVQQLTSTEVSTLTENFIKLMADADHNFFEDMGASDESNVDRDSILFALARTWQEFPSTVQHVTSGKFWTECKRMALNAYEHGALEI